MLQTPPPSCKMWAYKSFLDPTSYPRKGPLLLPLYPPLTLHLNDLLHSSVFSTNLVVSYGAGVRMNIIFSFLFPLFLSLSSFISWWFSPCSNWMRPIHIMESSLPHFMSTNLNVSVCVLSHVWLFTIPWTVAHQTPLSRNFPAKNAGEGCHFLLQENLWDPGIKLESLVSPALAGGFFTSNATVK